MIWIISPAKMMNPDKKLHTDEFTMPQFIDEAESLINLLKRLDPWELCSLMGISEELAEINTVRHDKWNRFHSISNSKQAIACYDGEVYKKLGTDDLEEDELHFMQRHLRIISGLYGILRPLDIIQPYRLEMGTKLINEKGKDLYEFWREKATAYLNGELCNEKDHILVNLASREYFKVLDTKIFQGKIINIIFKEYRNGKYKVVPFNAKRARGLMVRYMTKNNIDTLDKIKEFDLGYCYNEQLSTDKNLIFIKNSLFI